MIRGKATIEDQSVQQALGRLTQATSNMRPAMQGIGRRLKTLVQDGFRRGQDPWGAPWAPPVLRRGQPLRDTGRLRNSFTVDARDDRVQIGTNVCYAVVHQFGATITAQRPSGNNVCGYRPKGAPYLVFKGPGGAFIRKKQVRIPRRAMLPITTAGQAVLPPRWADEVVQEITGHIERAANARR